MIYKLVISLCLLIVIVFVFIVKNENKTLFEFEYQSVIEITHNAFDDTYPSVTSEQIVERYIIDRLILKIMPDELPYVHDIMKTPQRRSNANIDARALIEFQKSEIVCLATNMYHEARGEGRQGMVAVGLVTLNRKNLTSFPDTVCGVVYQSGQFAWIYEGHTRISERAAYEAALAAAEFVYRKQNIMHDYTLGAQYFLSPMPNGLPKPSWARRFEVTLKHGRHTFYRDNRV